MPAGRATAEDQALAAALEKARAAAGIRSISAIAWRGGKVTAQAAVGVTDMRTNAPASSDSIYMIASCSKPVIGLALALLMQDQPIDIDADINAWLKWDKPPRNPAFPDVVVTLRQLVTHRSSIVADDESEYATYARPDTDPNMDAYILEHIADPERLRAWDTVRPNAEPPGLRAGRPRPGHQRGGCTGGVRGDFGHVFVLVALSELAHQLQPEASPLHLQVAQIANAHGAPVAAVPVSTCHAFVPSSDTANTSETPNGDDAGRQPVRSMRRNNSTPAYMSFNHTNWPAASSDHDAGAKATGVELDVALASSSFSVGSAVGAAVG